MVELLTNIIQVMKIVGYGLLLAICSFCIKVKKWILALIGMALVSCVPYHRPFPVHGIMAMEVQCSVFSECEQFAANCCINGQYHVFAQGGHDLVFACQSSDNNRSYTFQ